MDKKQALWAYQKTKYSGDEAREALYRAASYAQDLNWSVMDVAFQLGDKAREDGLDDDSIEKIIRRAFSRDKREKERSAESLDSTESYHSYGKLDLDAESRRLLEQSRIDPDALSIPWPSDDWRKDLIKLLESAFDPHDMIDFKMAETPQAMRDSVSNILSQEATITKIMRSFDGDSGALIAINASNHSQPQDESWKFRYTVVDSPRMSLSKQLAFYKALNLPCAALINTGANSVQAWVKVEASDSSEYSERVDFLHQILEEHDFKVDTNLKSSTQFVRMPGVLRQGKQQYLIGLNEGAKSWKEWQEWVNYCLDGKPLIELASYHQQAPSRDTILIEGALRAGQSLCLVAPPQSGKSLALIDLALALCHGEEWLGAHTTESDVLYVNLDLTKPAFLNRLHTLGNERNLSPSTPRLGFLHIKGYQSSPEEMTQFLIRRIQGARKYEDHQYQTIIIDPLQALLQNMETQSSPRVLQQMIQQITAVTGSAVVTALCPQEKDLTHLTPDSWLELTPIDSHPNGYQLTGRFKDFPSLDHRECTWEYPRFKW